MNDKSSRGCERSVVDRILMNRAILARPDTDYHHPASIGYRVVFLPEIHRITLQSGPPPIRVSRIFDLVPFLSLSLSRSPFVFHHRREKDSLSLSLFPLLIRGRARAPTRHERNHKSFSLQLGDASSGKKLFGVSRSVTLPVVCVPILFSSIRILHAPKAPQSFPLRVSAMRVWTRVSHTRVCVCMRAVPPVLQSVGH